ncbi:MAG: polynucleotide kinase-phosphatase [Planctomycetota bacterium]|jgi:protein phosphatase
MQLNIPKLSLVVLIGPSGSGKSTFAREHFRATEVISSDACRGIVSDDENDQRATSDAFELLHYIARKRLAAGRLTVVDATNVRHEDRTPLIKIAREFHAIPVAIVFDLPEKLCQQRNVGRPDRNFGPHVIRQHRSALRRSMRALKKQGFRHIRVFKTAEEADAATVERVPLWNDKRDEHGPLDVIGDVHGCFDELTALLGELGYEPGQLAAEAEGDEAAWGTATYAHPEGRKAVFLGDIVDRGPKIVETLRLVRNMVAGGSAFCVPGNHDMKFMRKLRGKDVQITYGLADSLAQIDLLPGEVRESFCGQAEAFLDGLVSHYVFDDGRLVAAHAGLPEEMQGRGSGVVRQFALYGETTGETDEFGLPVRCNWAVDYRGGSMVVYGHTPVPQPEWLNRTINVDTGCVFGGSLTALRYPEKELISIPATEVYCEPVKPLTDERPDALTAQQIHDDVLDADDVLGKRIISTRLRSNITVRQENATAALETISRFAVDPKWLIYLPPTMSPCETSQREDLLEHPDEAFAYYRNQGVAKVVCQEKHMGSRAVVWVCRDDDAARRRFGVTSGAAGIIYTRTGRAFFDDAALEAAALDRIRNAFDAAGTWEQLETDWACLDCELMPWSAKAQELLKTQYAAVGAAARASLPVAIAALEQTAARSDNPAEATALLQRYSDRLTAIDRYVAAYRQYCWPVESLDDLKLAPFHLLATEGKVHVDRDHLWHMETLADICGRDSGLLLATAHKVLDVTDPASVAEGVAWWDELTGRGGEGMVVKPLEFVVRGRKGLAQPAVKVRGREYLRIIYGPEYTAAEHLSRLRQRGLGTKRSLAVREFALGIEALERFVRGEPLRRVHECVFGVLAMESEPVDPRL